MLDIVIPCLHSNTHLLPECIDLLFKGTDVPFKVIVVVDGGTRADLAGLEKYLQGSDVDWQLLHNEKPLGLNKALIDGLRECRRKLVAFVAPEVRLDDPKWVLKTKQVFEKDPICGIVDTEPNTKNSLSGPFKRRLHYPPMGCRFALLQTAFAQKTSPVGAVDPCEFWSRQAMAGGGTSWSSLGVRYHLVECKRHPLWKEPSEQVPTPASGSPSPKTPASPSPTTTTTAGGKGSAA